MTAQNQSLLLTTPEAATALAERLAQMLTAGDTLLLSGDLGTGKTHFARGVIQTLLAEHGAAEDVPSPTFTLVQQYDAGGTEIWHCDLYRLSGPAEVLELGLDEAFADAICLVEWPDRLGDLAPDSALRLDFSYPADGPGRLLQATATARRWTSIATLF